MPIKYHVMYVPMQLSAVACHVENKILGREAKSKNKLNSIYYSLPGYINTFRIFEFLLY